MATFGFIGIGNMGGAIAAAAAKAHDPADIWVSAGHPERAAAFANEHGMVASTNEEIARNCKFVVLGVKPQFMPQVLGALRPILEVRTDCVLVTMAAGMTMQQIANLVGGGYPVIRIMPNTPCAVGKGMILYCTNAQVAEEDLADFLCDMNQAGMFDRLDEKLIDAGSALSGCGPAFVCQFVESLADGAVECGLPRDKAMLYAIQTVMGTAKLMAESGQHPAVLKDAVCSPGGSTIAGVKALEDGAFRSAVMNCIMAASKRNSELGK